MKIVLTQQDLAAADTSIVSDNIQLQPVENETSWDNSTTNIPDLLKIVPMSFSPYIKAKKTKRPQIYSRYFTTILDEGQINQDFKTMFDTFVSKQEKEKLFKHVSIFANSNAKSENLLFTFKRYTNLEIVFSLDKDVQEDKSVLYKKFRVIVNLMPFSEFKYSPIETQTYEYKFQNGDKKEFESVMKKTISIFTEIKSSVAQISKHLKETQSIGLTLKKYVTSINL